MESKLIYKLDGGLANSVFNGTPEERYYVCEKSFALFCHYYFLDYFVFDTPNFHWEFFNDCEKLANGQLRDVAWIAFRESAKTTIAKFFVIWCICYKKKKYIAWDSYDGTNAESALFDITFQLQTNKLIIKDFGRLYRKKKIHKTKAEIEEDAPEIKRGDVFVTTNGIKVECFTTQLSARGRVTLKSRPDLFIFDDVENSITKESILLTGKIIRHIDEVNSGLGNTGAILYLGNYISEEGVIAHVMDRLEGKKGKLVRNIPIYNKQMVLAWPDKYVFTKDEALKLNVMLPREKHKLSIEQKKEDLGETVFNTEMLNDPGKSGDYYFDREKVRRAMEHAREPMKNVAGFKTWATFDARHRYGGGADTAEGVGADSCTTTIFDFTQRPMAIVATYKNNEIPPSTFAYEIKRHGEYFGECFFIPEINNTGYATLAELINLGYWNMYQREVKNKTTNKMTKEYGWRTTSGVKHDVFSQFKTAFEDGEFEIYDIDLLKEMYHYTKQNIRMLKKEEGMTRHFDLLTSAVLAWEARRYATPPKEEKKALYKSPNAGTGAKPYIV